MGRSWSDRTEGCPARPSPDRPADRPPPRIDVQHLLGGASEVRLAHGEQEYRLRLTRNRKLILTK